MTPRHDPANRRSPDRIARRALALAAERALQQRPRRKGGGDGAGEACPVEPNRPLDLSGGAAAALEFGE